MSNTPSRAWVGNGWSKLDHAKRGWVMGHGSWVMGGPSLALLHTAVMALVHLSIICAAISTYYIVITHSPSVVSKKLINNHSRDQDGEEIHVFHRQQERFACSKRKANHDEAFVYSREKRYPGH